MAGEFSVPFPVLGAVAAFLQRLRHPTLFKLMLGLMLLSWLWPFDPIPFIDEIVTLCATLWLGGLKKPAPLPNEETGKRTS